MIPHTLPHGNPRAIAVGGNSSRHSLPAFLLPIDTPPAPLPLSDGAVDLVAGLLLDVVEAADRQLADADEHAAGGKEGVGS